MPGGRPPAADADGLRVLRGHRVVRLTERGPLVEVVTRDVPVGDGPAGEQSVLRARWVVGCDGAHSGVRAHLGSTVEAGYGTGGPARLRLRSATRPCSARPAKPVAQP
jgi:2-polyprenyl-6-methoxyphenol hydroxylase-like FAD-dependent oxidoreductase